MILLKIVEKDRKGMVCCVSERKLRYQKCVTIRKKKKEKKKKTTCMTVERKEGVGFHKASMEVGLSCSWKCNRGSFGEPRRMVEGSGGNVRGAADAARG